jgi:hypothetical protein
MVVVVVVVAAAAAAVVVMLELEMILGVDWGHPEPTGRTSVVP